MVRPDRFCQRFWFPSRWEPLKGHGCDRMRISHFWKDTCGCHRLEKVLEGATGKWEPGLEIIFTLGSNDRIPGEGSEDLQWGWTAVRVGNLSSVIFLASDPTMCPSHTQEMFLKGVLSAPGDGGTPC